MLKFRSFTMLKFSSFALRNFRRYFELRNVRILHCEIFIFCIVKFSYFTLRNCGFLAFRICEISKRRKMKKILEIRLFFAMRKAKYSHFVFAKIANFGRSFRFRNANFTMRNFGISHCENFCKKHT